MNVPLIFAVNSMRARMVIPKNVVYSKCLYSNFHFHTNFKNKNIKMYYIFQFLQNEITDCFPSVVLLSPMAILTWRDAISLSKEAMLTDISDICWMIFSVSFPFAFNSGWDSSITKSEKTSANKATQNPVQLVQISSRKDGYLHFYHIFYDNKRNPVKA